MDFRTITDTSSTQFQYVTDALAVNGYLYLGDYVCVAMGSYYGELGSKFIITLESGQRFKAIKIEEKSDQHTTNGCYDSKGGIIEFVIDEKTMSNQTLIDGTSYEYQGRITEIEREE